MWRYKMNGTPAGVEPRDSWSIVFVDQDGCLSIISDYGNWGHRWNAAGFGSDDMRKELLSMDASYLRGKLSYGQAREFQAERTLKSVRELIAQYQEQSELPKLEAELDSNAIERVGSTIDYYDFLNAVPGRWNRYMEAAVYDVHNASGLDHWCKVSFERLKVMIRLQLNGEADRKPPDPN
jgi:hypothetical protein